MPNNLEGKVAVVTGAGRGVGRGVALLMAEEGAKVVVNDVGAALSGEGEDKAPADQVVEQIRKAGGTAVANYDSVATGAGGENIIRTALDNFGKLDIVVTVAGILRDRMIFNMTEAEWDAVIAVHLKGTFTVVKPASVLFRQQRSGRIITFTSATGIFGNAGQANYGAAKGGIAGFTRVVARDLGKYGVTCNSIAPRALTRMTENIPPETMQRRAAQGRATVFPQPEDVAPMVCYLATDAASHINGQIFVVYSGNIDLVGQPRPTRSIFTPDPPWSLDDMDRLAPEYITQDLPNLAPPQPPKS